MNTKRIFSGALCAALLSSLLVLPAQAVSATVVKPDNTPLADAKVTCQIKDNGAWRDWASESYKIEGSLDGSGGAPDYSGLKEGAEDYGQSPSMFTDTDGRCGWMLPQGTFRFQVTAEGYKDYISPEFTVGTQAGNKSNSDSLGQLKLTSGSGSGEGGGNDRPSGGGGGGYMPWLTPSGSSDPKPEPTKPVTETRPGSLKADAASVRYLAGYDDGTFRPNQPITRYEVAQALTYLLTLGDGTKADALSDVAPEHAAAVSRLAEAGLINGMGDGTFRGEDSLTRAQIAKILCLVLELEPDAQSASSFSDIGRHWGTGYIGALTKAGHLKGYTDGTFRPDQPMTRAELAALLNRVAGRKDVAGQAPEFTDVPARFWGCEDIRNAALPATDKKAQ